MLAKEGTVKECEKNCHAIRLLYKKRSNGIDVDRHQYLEEWILDTQTSKMRKLYKTPTIVEKRHS